MGILEHLWFMAIMVHSSWFRVNGIMESRNYGITEKRNYGDMDLWIYGDMESRNYGNVELRSDGKGVISYRTI